MNILAIETSTPACSVALQTGGGEVRERFEQAAQRHTEMLLPMIRALLADAQMGFNEVDVIAFARGPGAFTGLRVSASIVQALAMAADTPVVPVSTLAVMAQGAQRLHGVKRSAIAIDARMNEVYWACYAFDDDQTLHTVCEEQVCSPDQVALPPEGTWVGAGSGWLEYGESLKKHMGDKLAHVLELPYPRAQDVLLLASQAYGRGESVTPEQAVPVYLRDEVAKKMQR